MPSRPAPTLFDSGLKVLLLTAAAYVFAFIYECSYLIHFGIPTPFIDVSLHELLVGGAFCLIPICVVMWLDLFWDSFPVSFPPRLSKILMTLVIMFVGVLTLCLLLNAPMSLTVAPLASILFLGTALLVIPIISQRHLPRIANRYWAVFSNDDSKSLKQPRILWIPVSTGLIVAFGMILITGVFAFAIGSFRARTQTDFAVHELSDGCAVLRLSSDGYLCVGIDFQKHVAAGTFRLLDPKGIDLHITKIGRIAPFQTVIVAAPPPPAVPPATH